MEISYITIWVLKNNVLAFDGLYELLSQISLLTLLISHLVKFIQTKTRYNVLLQSNPQTWQTTNRRRNSTIIGL